MGKGSTGFFGTDPGRSGLRPVLFWLAVLAGTGFAFAVDGHLGTSPDATGSGQVTSCSRCTDAAPEGDENRGADGFPVIRALPETATPPTGGGPASAGESRLASIESPSAASRPYRHGVASGASCAERTVGIGTGCSETRRSYPDRKGQRPGETGLVLGGRIMDRDGLGLEGITVFASAARVYAAGDNDGAAPADRVFAVTDPSGHYRFNGLPDGEYVVRTGSHGVYGPARMSARAGLLNADLVLVEQESWTVTGQVLDESGEPLEGVTVLPVLLGVPSTRTDAEGRYRLPVAANPGTRAFNLRFQCPGFIEQHATARPPPSPLSDEITVDAEMRAVQYWTNLQGTVKGTEGIPLANRTVRLRPVSGDRVYTTTTDGRGRYAFDAVEAPVAYQLTVNGAPDHQDHSERIRVESDTTEFDVIVRPFEFGKVSGRLVNLDGAPVADFNLVLRHAHSSAPNAIVTSDGSGNFSVPGVPAGELVVASQSTPSIRVSGVRLEAGDELELPLVLDWGEHEIRGVVLDAGGHPVPASRVVLTWSHREDGISTLTTRRTVADAQGVFHFASLGPGPHSLQIDTPGRSPVEIIHDIGRQGYALTVRLN